MCGRRRPRRPIPHMLRQAAALAEARQKDAQGLSLLLGVTAERAQVTDALRHLVTDSDQNRREDRSENQEWIEEFEHHTLAYFEQVLDPKRLKASI
jgi:hypothetical protein